MTMASSMLITTLIVVTPVGNGLGYVSKVKTADEKTCQVIERLVKIKYEIGIRTKLLER